jgi:hypothetical protein
MKITFYDLSTKHDNRETGIRKLPHEDRMMMIDRAVKRLYGKHCYWIATYGIGWNYGQVFKPEIGENVAITGKIRIDIIR